MYNIAEKLCTTSRQNKWTISEWTDIRMSKRLEPCLKAGIHSQLGQRFQARDAKKNFNHIVQDCSADAFGDLGGEESLGDETRVEKEVTSLMRRWFYRVTQPR
ncbi:hypothetical protein LY76DRAFT_610983 [Colletotrichum caudatum]|nr:hypothetical protein LY76DRAFT_610983 [Colletotrichum caudatum]